MEVILVRFLLNLLAMMAKFVFYWEYVLLLPQVVVMVLRHTLPGYFVRRLNL